jgi:RNA polymerase sigma-70 factor (ECF subfamily)
VGAEQDLLTHWPAMVRACERVVASREDAEDCASEALVAALRRGGLGDVRNEEAWLVSVAKRKAIDVVRGDVRGRKRAARIAGEHPIDAADAAEAVLDQAEARWLAQQSRALLAPAAAEVLEAVADGHSIADAADRLGMTKRAAESHLHRARAALRTAWTATLGVLSWLAGARRWGQTAPAAALAAGLILSLSPGLGAAGPSGISVPSPLTSADTNDSAPVSPAHTSQLGAAAAGSSRRPADRSLPHASAGGKGLHSVQTRAAGVQVTQETRPGPADPVGAAVWCVQHLHVSPTAVGC